LLLIFLEAFDDKGCYYYKLGFCYWSSSCMTARVLLLILLALDEA